MDWNAAGFFVFFAVMWLIVTTILAVLSGWFRLMEAFPDQPSDPILRLRAQSGRIGPLVRWRPHPERLHGRTTRWDDAAVWAILSRLPGSVAEHCRRQKVDLLRPGRPASIWRPGGRRASDRRPRRRQVGQRGDGALAGGGL